MIFLKGREFVIELNILWINKKFEFWGVMKERIYKSIVFILEGNRVNEEENWERWKGRRRMWKWSMGIEKRVDVLIFYCIFILRWKKSIIIFN